MSLDFSRLFFKSVSLYQPNFERYKILEAMKLSNQTQSIDQNHLWTIISQPFQFTKKTTKKMLCRLQLTVNLDIILFLVTIIIAKSFISFVILKSIFLWKSFSLLQINQLIQKIDITSINIWNNDINYKNPLRSWHKP